MPKETEAKFRVAAHEPVRQRLIRARATFVARVLETNRIFDRPDGSLRAAGSGLRLRHAREENRGSVTTVTFKGPVASGPFKSREELEMAVTDADIAAEFLKRLGFVEILAYEKRRESWRLGDCLVELDEPPYIGLFVEIEGPEENAICAARDELRLSEATYEEASYVQMMLAYRSRHRLPNALIRMDGGHDA